MEMENLNPQLKNRFIVNIKDDSDHNIFKDYQIREVIFQPKIIKKSLIEKIKSFFYDEKNLEITLFLTNDDLKNNVMDDLSNEINYIEIIYLDAKNEPNKTVKIDNPKLKMILFDELSYNISGDYNGLYIVRLVFNN